MNQKYAFLIFLLITHVVLNPTENESNNPISESISDPITEILTEIIEKPNQDTDVFESENEDEIQAEKEDEKQAERERESFTNSIRFTDNNGVTLGLDSKCNPIVYALLDETHTPDHLLETKDTDLHTYCQNYQFTCCTKAMVSRVNKKIKLGIDIINNFKILYRASFDIIYGIPDTLFYQIVNDVKNTNAHCLEDQQLLKGIDDDLSYLLHPDRRYKIYKMGMKIINNLEKRYSSAYCLLCFHNEKSKESNIEDAWDGFSLKMTRLEFIRHLRIFQKETQIWKYFDTLDRMTSFVMCKNPNTVDSFTNWLQVNRDEEDLNAKLATIQECIEIAKDANQEIPKKCIFFLRKGALVFRDKLFENSSIVAQRWIYVISKSLNLSYDIIEFSETSLMAELLSMRHNENRKEENRIKEVYKKISIKIVEKATPVGVYSKIRKHIQTLKIFAMILMVSIGIV